MKKLIEKESYIVKRRDGSIIHLCFSTMNDARWYLEENYQKLGLRKGDVKTLRIKKKNDDKNLEDMYKRASLRVNKGRRGRRKKV